jgi:hypothetical protein
MLGTFFKFFSPIFFYLQANKPWARPAETQVEEETESKPVEESESEESEEEEVKEIRIINEIEEEQPSVTETKPMDE